MIYFKACHRCKGDMAQNKDRYGFYLQCLQCARIYDLVPVSRVRKAA